MALGRRHIAPLAASGIVACMLGLVAVALVPWLSIGFL